MVVARGAIAFGILVAILDPARATSLYSNDRQGVNDCCSGCNSSTSHFGYTEATCHGRSSSLCGGGGGVGVGVKRCTGREINIMSTQEHYLVGFFLG